MSPENQHIDPAGILPKIVSGEATPDEKKLFNEWLSESKENRDEYESFRKLWNITAPQSGDDEINIDTEWRKIEAIIEPSRKLNLTFNRVLQVAASVLLISVLTYFGIRSVGSETKKAPATRLSEYRLPDGSVVSLNAGSKIIYKKGFGLTHRNLALKGEGFFDVEKSGTPFIISAGEANIRVTGTEFNVSAYETDPEFKVTVTEGTVRIYPAGQPDSETLISAGETGLFNRNNNTVLKSGVFDLNDLAWKTLIIEFHNTPLSEVTEILSNTYHRTITADTSVQHCTVTVRFDNQEADSVLNVLKSTLDLTIIRKGKRILITGTGC